MRFHVSPAKKILFTLTYVENIGIQLISSAFNLHSSPSWFNSLYQVMDQLHFT